LLYLAYRIFENNKKLNLIELSVKSVIRTWAKSDEKIILKTKVFSVSQHEAQLDEKKGEFVVIHAPDWINIIAETEAGEIIVIYQYRHGLDCITLEIPGGVMDKGEDPLESAKRELLEETGFESDEWTKLGVTAVNPAIMNNHTHLFYAGKCKKVAEQDLDEHEDIEIKLLSKKVFLEKVRNGEINHSLIMAAVCLWNLSQKEGSSLF
jgi:ADP-ribose pyrophosphatase